MAEPLRVSVVIPTRNRPLLLSRAVASALANLPDAAEVVVVDDGSTPAAELALRAATGDDPRLRVVRNGGPHGASIARNLGVGAALGEVIFFLDDDDLMVPGYITGVLAARGSYAWGFCPALTHAEDAPPLLAPLDHPRWSPVPMPLGRAHLTGLGYGFWVERARFLSVGGLDPALLVNEDTDFCLRLLSANLFPLRADAAGVSLGMRTAGAASQAASVTQSARAADRARYFARIMDRHARFLADAPGLQSFLRKRQVKMLAKSGQITAGLRLALAARSPALVVYCLLNAALYANSR